MDFSVRRYQHGGRIELTVPVQTPVGIPSILDHLQAADGDVIRIEKVPKGVERAPGLGWVCPKCKRVYAPTVLECVRCNGRKR